MEALKPDWPMTPYQKCLNALFWAKVLRGLPDDCWPWQGFTKPSGHGLTSLQSLPIHAHRKAWILTYGPIRGADICVLHKCDNPVCCNTSHMYLGTRAQNSIDRWTKPKPEYRTSSGRTRILTDAQLEQLWKMRREGATLNECAAKFGVHIATVCRYITLLRKRAVARFHADRVSASQK
ncbi:MAG TPA: HNH endonuclease [Nitrospiraceae bacterium]|nr:HNH endonuclease [Nitrospiraceae bacterium]